eukprot:Opistho-2@88671
MCVCMCVCVCACACVCVCICAYLCVCVCVVPADRRALDTLKPGDVTTIFTPDDTHYEIAKYAIEKGIHVLLTKPPVKTLREHNELVQLAHAKGVFVMVEYHKRFDPIYSDARARIRTLGDFGYFNSYMSQPKSQLKTFSAWAGAASDISYYLNSHHIDIHAWAMQDLADPVSVVAMGANGVADGSEFNCPKGTEDTITLLVQWKNRASGNLGTAVYTASWASPPSDVHSQQRFHYMGHKGEVTADQARRGYNIATDANGYQSINPLYMAYFPGPDGNFAGHHGYGYRSLENFVDACRMLNAKKVSLADLDLYLPTLRTTAVTTAILEAGRRSLDSEGSRIGISTSRDGIVALDI